MMALGGPADSAVGGAAAARVVLASGALAVRRLFHGRSRGGRFGAARHQCSAGLGRPAPALRSAGELYMDNGISFSPLVAVGPERLAAVLSGAAFGLAALCRVDTLVLIIRSSSASWPSTVSGRRAHRRAATIAWDSCCSRPCSTRSPCRSPSRCDWHATPRRTKASPRSVPSPPPSASSSACS